MKLDLDRGAIGLVRTDVIKSLTNDNRRRLCDFTNFFVFLHDLLYPCLEPNHFVNFQTVLQHFGGLTTGNLVCLFRFFMVAGEYGFMGWMMEVREKMRAL